MEKKRILAILAIIGLVTSGYAFAQTNKVQETIASIGQAASVSTASKPISSETMPIRPVPCKKTTYGGCISIECEDGFSMKQCQDACTSRIDGNGCKVTVCNGVESKECPQVSEEITCIFTNTNQAQKCESIKGGCTAYPPKCEDGIKCVLADYLSCTVKVSGDKGDILSWKSSCGGYGKTTVDAVDEKVKFSCLQPCMTYTDNKGCIVRECPGQPTITACQLREKTD
jgi:hypothetical protein